MLIKKRHITALSLLVTLCNPHRVYSFNMQHLQRNLNQHVKALHDDIQNMFNQFEQTFADSGNRPENLAISIEENDTHVIVRCPLGKDITTFDASLEQNSIIIDVPEIHQKIIIRVGERYLTVSTEVSHHADTDKDEQSTALSYGAHQIGQSIEGIIDREQLEKKLNIAYAQDTLTISIPKIIPTSHAKKLNVTIQK